MVLRPLPTLGLDPDLRLLSSQSNWIVGLGAPWRRTRAVLLKHKVPVLVLAKASLERLGVAVELATRVSYLTVLFVRATGVLLGRRGSTKLIVAPLAGSEEHRAKEQKQANRYTSPEGLRRGSGRDCSNECRPPSRAQGHTLMKATINVPVVNLA